MATKPELSGSARPVPEGKLTYEEFLDWCDEDTLAEWVQMRLPPPISVGREPDLIFVAREHLDRLRPTYLDGPADLAIEITSPESIGRNRGEKFIEYEQAKIPEYWLIDPARRQAEFYRLGADGFYRAEVLDSDGAYESPVLGGLRLPVDWLWQDPLPSGSEALRTLGLLG